MYEQIPDVALDAARYWATMPKPRQPQPRSEYLRRFGFRRVGEAAENYNPTDMRGTYDER